MNRSKLAVLSEILSSIAVVVTLIYLTVEVRQNTDALRAQSRQAVLEASQAELAMLVEDPSLGLAFSEGRSLSPEEHVQVDAWLTGALRTREYSWLQYRERSVDEAQWATERAVILSIFDDPLARLWWERQGRHAVSSEFVAYLDSLMAANRPTRRMWNTTWSLPDSLR
jgi:hypothetical protein